MKRLILLIVSLTLFPAMPTTAQSDCDLESLRAGIVAAESIAELREANRALSFALATCLEMTFSGTTDDVIGPLQFDEGSYILEFLATQVDREFTSPVLSIEPIPVTGDEYVAAIYEYGTDADIAGRQVLRVEGGTYLINIKIDDLADWSVTIVKP